MPFSLMSSISWSHASSFGMPRRTTSLPTYKSTLPGAPPTYPKSASAISPGPLTMQPMIAIATPGRWPVREEICAVTSCRSKRVRPQEGQETNSVLVERIRAPCSSPKEVVRRKSVPNEAPSCGTMATPSPSPSQSRPPTCEPSCSASSFPSDGGGRKAWMTAESIPSCSKREKTRREACSREREAGGSSSTKACGSAFSWRTSSALSSPLRRTTTRPAQGGAAPLAASSSETRATAPSTGAAARAAAESWGGRRRRSSPSPTSLPSISIQHSPVGLDEDIASKPGALCDSFTQPSRTADASKTVPRVCWPTGLALTLGSARTKHARCTTS
mmetsp:Transcript_20756/g.66843  ORF Transcript_20756/g.66843 Transcript_20756/m.66843 type:complete len:331 (+) Transcript_20756:314-1306(+)